MSFKEFRDFLNFASRYEIKNLITYYETAKRFHRTCDQVFDFIPRCKVKKIDTFLINNMVCYNVVFNFKALVYRQNDVDVIALAFFHVIIIEIKNIDQH